MTYAVIVQNSKNGDNSVVSDSLDTSTANFGSVAASWLSSAVTPNLTDNKGNTWVRRTVWDSFFNMRHAIFDCVAPVVGTNHQLTLVGDGGLLIGSFNAQFGLNSAGPLVFDAQYGSPAVANADTVAVGPLTPSEANSLVISGLSFNGPDGITASVDGGFTISGQINDLGGVRFGAAQAYLLQSSAAAADPTWSSGGSAFDMVASLASYKPAALPTITDVNTTNIVVAGSTGNVATGTNLSGVDIRINQNANSLDQTVTGTTSTTATFDQDNGFGLGELLFHGSGVLEAENVNGTGSRSIDLPPEAGKDYVIIATPAPNLDWRVEADPEPLDTGNEVEHDEETSLGDDIDVEDDGSLSQSDGSYAVDFDGFPAATNQDLSSPVISDPVAIAGDAAAIMGYRLQDGTGWGTPANATVYYLVPITVSGGQWRKNGGAFTFSDGTAVLGDEIEVVGISSDSYNTETQVILTVDGVPHVFSITTENGITPSYDYLENFKNPADVTEVIGANTTMNDFTEDENFSPQ